MNAIVQTDNTDSIRVEVLGESRAVTIPATLLLAADRVMRHCLVSGEDMAVENVSIGEMTAFVATVGAITADGETAWGALRNLADKLEG